MTTGMHELTTSGQARPAWQDAERGGRRRKPAVGMRLTFTAAACAELAGIPAEVTYVWPRFRSGEYLVTLEYQEPVKLGKVFIRHIDAFVSELEPLVRKRAQPGALDRTGDSQPASRHAPRSGAT